MVKNRTLVKRGGFFDKQLIVLVSVFAVLVAFSAAIWLHVSSLIEEENSVYPVYYFIPYADALNEANLFIDLVKAHASNDEEGREIVLFDVEQIDDQTLSSVIEFYNLDPDISQALSWEQMKQDLQMLSNKAQKHALTRSDESIQEALNRYQAFEEWFYHRADIVAAQEVSSDSEEIYLLSLIKGEGNSQIDFDKQSVYCPGDEVFWTQPQCNGEFALEKLQGNYSYLCFDYQYQRGER